MQRRNFLKLGSLSVVAAAAPKLVGAESQPPVQQLQKPNIIFVISDQHRADLTKREGYPLDTSPALDKLAARGIAFDRAYCTSPLCVPSRTSMLTGRWPEATHVRSNKMLNDAFYPTHLYKVARENGYKTGLAGENHTFLKQEDTDFWRTA